MRKQYHFRKSNDGLLAWDVDTLIALTVGLVPESIPLDKIQELNEAYWYESGNDVPTCRSIAEHLKLVLDTNLLYPIIVCPDGRVMDGMHRVVKAVVYGHESIQAYRLPVLPRPDYIGMEPGELPYAES